MRRSDGNLSFNSETKWEGGSLLISTIVSSPTVSYTIADHWRLSRDGNRLTIERAVSERGGEIESTLVYERVDRPGAPLPMITTAEPASRPVPAPVLRTAEQPATAPSDYVVQLGTRVPLRLLNAVSTQHSVPGDRVYLETVYPVVRGGRVVIPPGSYVLGSLTEVKRAGHAKGKSEMFLRFDSITLPNGTTKDFKSRMSNTDADSRGTFDRKEGKIEGEGRRGSDAKRVGETAAAGVGIGAIAGSAAGHLGMGAGVGAAAGALGGLIGVLASRGPDAVLPKGSTVEMVLDRDITFAPDELAGGH